jgi:putative membrane protein
MKHLGFTALALTIAITAACGGGTREDRNDDDAVIGTSGEGVPRTVERFVNDVVAGNTAEIELSRMAAERATNPEVKEFAQTMVREHTAAGNELKQALTPHRIQVRDVMDEKHRDLSQELSRKSGSEFDHEYMAAMVDDHERMKNLLEGRANEKPNNQPVENAVNQFAAKTLPAVQHHLEMAQQLEDRLDDTPRRNTTQ